MREMPILFFRKDAYVLATPAEGIARIENGGGRKFLWLKGRDQGVPVDDVLDFLFLPLERLHALPAYIQISLQQDRTIWSGKTIWGFVRSEDTLFPMIDLKALAEGMANEEP